MCWGATPIYLRVPSSRPQMHQWREGYTYRPPLYKTVVTSRPQLPRSLAMKLHTISSYNGCRPCFRIKHHTCSNPGRWRSLGWTKAVSLPGTYLFLFCMFSPRRWFGNQRRNLHDSDWIGIFQAAANCEAMLHSARCTHNFFSSDILGQHLHRLMAA